MLKTRTSVAALVLGMWVFAWSGASRAALAFDFYQDGFDGDFYQDGFDDRASVTGMFVGDDLDGNGQLSSFNKEVYDFEMSFSGNSLVPAFTLGYSDLVDLVYDLDGGPLGDGTNGDSEGIGAKSESFEYKAGPGPVYICGIGEDCAQVTDMSAGGKSVNQELVQVSSVPLPSALSLMAIALAGVGFAGRRKPDS